MRLCFFVLLFCAAISFECVLGLDFRVVDNSPICFVDDSNNPHIMGRYERRQSNTSRPRRMMLTAYREDGSVLHEEEMTSGIHFLDIPKGEVVQADEFFYVCCAVSDADFKATDQRSEERVRFILYDAGNMPISSSDVRLSERREFNGQAVYSFQDVSGQLKSVLVNKEDLVATEASVVKIQQQMENFISELQRISKNEKAIRRISEKTFTRIWVASFSLALAIAFSTSLQYRYLKSTIRKKKLI